MDVVFKGFATIGNFDPTGAFGKNLARHDAVGCAEGDFTGEQVEVKGERLHRLGGCEALLASMDRT